jgi:hypothetical protein
LNRLAEEVKSNVANDKDKDIVKVWSPFTIGTAFPNEVT